jgi:hypothetical protein
MGKMSQSSYIRRRGIFILATLFVMSAGYLFEQRVVLGQGRAAFTAITRQTSYHRAGDVALTETGLFAIRSDGSFVTVRNVGRPDGRGVGMQRLIFDLAHAEEVGIDELTQSTTTIPLLKSAIELYQGRPMCTDDPSPQHATILGYDVVRHLRLIGKQAARITRKEEWRAPALDCLALRETLVIGRTEADTYTASVKEVLQVATGEPASWLFDRPNGFLERKPSERTKELASLYPQITVPECVNQSEKQLDELYSRRQADKGK